MVGATAGAFAVGALGSHASGVAFMTSAWPLPPDEWLRLCLVDRSVLQGLAQVVEVAAMLVSHKSMADCAGLLIPAMRD